MRNDFEPLISILMPVYNAELYIKDSLNSILNQTYKNIELLVCDDKSTDNSLLIIDSFNDSRINVFKNDNNVGYLKTCNFLFQKCQGEFIGFQDADDWSDLTRLEKQVKLFLANPDLGICGTYAQYYLMDGKEKTFQTTPKCKHIEIYEEITRHNQFCGASIMVKRDVLKTVGSYREYFDRIANEDYDWSSRVVERYHSQNIPEYLYHVRQSSGSISRKVRSPKQLITVDIVRNFIRQRRMGGQDMLECNDIDSLHKLESKFLRPYQNDNSLMYRKAADVAYYNSLYYEYIRMSFIALMVKPLYLINWKYIVTSLFRYIKNIKFI